MFLYALLPISFTTKLYIKTLSDTEHRFSFTIIHIRISRHTDHAKPIRVVSVTFFMFVFYNDK